MGGTGPGNRSPSARTDAMKDTGAPKRRTRPISPSCGGLPLACIPHRFGDAELLVGDGAVRDARKVSVMRIDRAREVPRSLEVHPSVDRLGGERLPQPVEMRWTFTGAGLATAATCPSSSASSCGECMHGSQVEPARPQRNHEAESRDNTETRANAPTLTATTGTRSPRHPRPGLHPCQRPRSKRRHTSRARKRALGGSYPVESGSHRLRTPWGDVRTSAAPIGRHRARPA